MCVDARIKMDFPIKCRRWGKIPRTIIIMRINSFFDRFEKKEKKNRTKKKLRS